MRMHSSSRLWQHGDWETVTLSAPQCFELASIRARMVKVPPQSLHV
ncbi:hypothetical protein [Armatimonas sp.]